MTTTRASLNYVLKLSVIQHSDQGWTPESERLIEYVDGEINALVMRLVREGIAISLE